MRLWPDSKKFPAKEPGSRRDDFIKSVGKKS